jgi:hypothetical protein
MTGASYVLPIRCGADGPPPDLTGYLGRLAAWLDVVVVDGSDPDVFAANARRWDRLPIRHVPPGPDVRCTNGKVAGVLTGVRLAAHDRVVIADDDVRYDDAALRRTVALLDGTELVRPQNYFAPRPWHAAWDTARSLLNRLAGGDYPRTLAVRRSLLLATGGYDGDVLFENLELIRTVRAAGGRIATPLDLFVARRPPSTDRFWSQRVRQAYDDFAQPPRLALALAVVPGLAGAMVRSRDAGRALRRVTTAASAVIVAAELGRRRGGGRTVFPFAASLLAPAWVVERGVCAWLALAVRLRHGGCPYAGRIIVRAANPQRRLRRRYGDLASARRSLPGQDQEPPAEPGEVTGGPAEGGVVERAGAEAPDEFDFEPVMVEELLHAAQGGGVEERWHAPAVEGPAAERAGATEG